MKWRVGGGAAAERVWRGAAPRFCPPPRAPVRRTSAPHFLLQAPQYCEQAAWARASGAGPVRAGLPAVSGPCWPAAPGADHSAAASSTSCSANSRCMVAGCAPVQAARWGSESCHCWGLVQCARFAPGYSVQCKRVCRRRGGQPLVVLRAPRAPSACGHVGTRSARSALGPRVARIMPPPPDSPPPSPPIHAVAVYKPGLDGRVAARLSSRAP